MLPSSLMARSIGSVFGASSWVLGLAVGSFTVIRCDISGAVIMKMISNTNITSTSGVTLISDIGEPDSFPELIAMGQSSLMSRSDAFDACAGGEEVVQVMREFVETGVRQAVGTSEEVVGEHGRDSSEQ